MAAQSITTDTYKLFPSPRNRHRAICPPNCLHGHKPMRRNVGEQLIPIASQRDPL